MELRRRTITKNIKTDEGADNNFNIDLNQLNRKWKVHPHNYHHSNELQQLTINNLKVVHPTSKTNGANLPLADQPSTTNYQYCLRLINLRILNC
jgi:hypothetical protein